MLEKQANGTGFRKVDHCRPLLTQLDDRSPNAVRYKHRNVSWILQVRGIAIIVGYSPVSHHQRLLAEVVDEYLDGNPGCGAR